jgi:hypothetical protein
MTYFIFDPRSAQPNLQIQAYKKKIQGAPKKMLTKKKQVIGGPQLLYRPPNLILPPYMASPTLGISNIELLI